MVADNGLFAKQLGGVKRSPGTAHFWCVLLLFSPTDLHEQSDLQTVHYPQPQHYTLFWKKSQSYPGVLWNVDFVWVLFALVFFCPLWLLRQFQKCITVFLSATCIVRAEFRQLKVLNRRDHCLWSPVTKLDVLCNLHFDLRHDSFWKL